LSVKNSWKSNKSTLPKDLRMCFRRCPGR